MVSFKIEMLPPEDEFNKRSLVPFVTITACSDQGRVILFTSNHLGCDREIDEFIDSISSNLENARERAKSLLRGSVNNLQK